jgi:2-polyprenyl-6-methoxyphenol hydroxylase-like FAD-dependent oxidoreductase
VRAALSDGGVVRARFLAGADGARSTIRAMLGIGSTSWARSPTSSTCSFART